VGLSCSVYALIAREYTVFYVNRPILHIHFSAMLLIKRRKQKPITTVDGRVVTRVCNKAGRLYQVKEGANVISTYAY